MIKYVAVYFLTLFSSKSFACAGSGIGAESALLFFVYIVSGALALYSVFSRLTHQPKMVLIPICVAMLGGYFGIVEHDCVDSSPLLQSLITLSVCVVLSIFETYLRRKTKK